MAGFLEEYSGSAFWLLITLISLLGLTLLGLWAFHNQHLQGAIIAMIFFAMIFSGMLLAIISGKEVYNLGTWTQSCVGFSIGFIIYYLLGGAGKSVLAITENSLFSAVVGDLPRAIAQVLNIFVIPFAEEMLWIIGIPYTMMALFEIGGRKYKFLKNPLLQIATIGLVSALSFAFFHISKLVLAFIIGAMLFRLITIFMVLGEQKADWLKWLMVPPAAALGAHIGNNMASAGILSSFSTLLGYNPPIAIVMYGFLAVVFLTAVNGIIEFGYDKVIAQ